LGVSRKIGTEEERFRLKRILQTHRAGMTGGFIMRTAGEGKTEEEIAADMTFLYNMWMDIRQKSEKKPAPALIHHDLDIVQRILRDQLTENFKAIWIDNEEVYESVLRFVQRFQPVLVPRVKLYTRPAPIFEAFSITSELEKALRPKVWLKSGGYIVINQTEALVAIDVNTGKFVGKSNRLEDTIVKTNTEAVKEIVRQIRLRDLGGVRGRARAPHSIRPRPRPPPPRRTCFRCFRSWEQRARSGPIRQSLLPFPGITDYLGRWRTPQR
jgi:ribonuclease G